MNYPDSTRDQVNTLQITIKAICDSLNQYILQLIEHSLVSDP